MTWMKWFFSPTVKCCVSDIAFTMFLFGRLIVSTWQSVRQGKKTKKKQNKTGSRLPWLLWSIHAGFSRFSTRISFSFMESLNCCSRGQGLREAQYDIFGLVEEWQLREAVKIPKASACLSGFGKKKATLMLYSVS